ncbi:hypothetical protein [Psychrobacter sp. I-STPA6b]|uniref:hypothetical protein n=1 Tax=Psychrobacter sp. I-STPA6b TaxID=2585718 RepID=UPI001D0C6BBA|nr:hypothetical protein [Psychrobacter sp. I-STPA6b]
MGQKWRRRFNILGDFCSHSCRPLLSARLGKAVTQFGAFHLNERPPQNLATATCLARQDNRYRQG